MKKIFFLILLFPFFVKAQTDPAPTGATQKNVTNYQLGDTTYLFQNGKWFSVVNRAQGDNLFIQNRSTSQQPNSSFWISGQGIIGTTPTILSNWLSGVQYTPTTQNGVLSSQLIEMLASPTANTANSYYGQYIHSVAVTNVTMGLVGGLFARSAIRASATVTSAPALTAASPFFNGTGAITNAYGLYLQPQFSVASGTPWGVYAPGQNDFSLFGGNVGVGGASPPGSSFVVTQQTTGEGAATVTSGSPTVTGATNISGAATTNFTNTFRTGDNITIAGQTRVVQTVTNDLSLTVTANFTVNSVIPPPQLLQLTASTGTLTAGTYYFVVTAVNGIGQTTKSNEVSIVLSATGGVQVQFSPVIGAVSYNVYRGTTPGGENVFQNTTNYQIFIDHGAGTSGTPPGSNSALGAGAYTLVGGDVARINANGNIQFPRLQSVTGVNGVVVDANGNLGLGSAGGTTIYTGDGTLAGPRTVTMNNNPLTITDVTSSTGLFLNPQSGSGQAAMFWLDHSNSAQGGFISDETGDGTTWYYNNSGGVQQSIILSGVVGEFANNMLVLDGISSTGLMNGSDYSTAIRLHPWALMQHNTAVAIGDSIKATISGGISGSGTTNRIAKFTGTSAIGNSLLFDNGTSVGVNTTSPSATFDVVTTSTSTIRGSLFDQYSTDANGAKVYERKSRGTVASPTTIVTADAIASHTFSAYDGTQFTDAAKILVSSTGTISNGVVPATMAFQTATSAGTLTTGLLIDQAQAITMGHYTTNNGLLFTNGSGVVSQSTALPNGTTATTQTTADNTTKVATDAFVNATLSASYVPYTGATGAVTLGSFAFTSNGITNSNTSFIWQNPNVQTSIGGYSDVMIFNPGGGTQIGVITESNFMNNFVSGTSGQLAKFTGTNVVGNATAGTDYQAPVTLTTTGTSGAATFISNTLNIPQYAGATFANPTGTIGLSAVNGSLTTAMRSDAAPPLSQGIVPTWTGLHTFTPTNSASSGAGSANYGVAFNPTLNQTSTAGFSGIYENVTPTGTGSGTKRVIDLNWNGAPLFSVSSAGVGVFANSVSLSAGGLSAPSIYANGNTSMTYALNGGANFGGIGLPSNTNLWGGGFNSTGAGGTMTFVWEWNTTNFILPLLTGSQLVATDANKNLISVNAPQILATVTGINAKSTGTTALYTVPTGKTLTVTGVYVTPTAASSITVGPSADVGVTAGDVYANTAMTTLTTTGKVFQYVTGGVYSTSASTAVLNFNINTAATGTSETLTVTVTGYLQ